MNMIAVCDHIIDIGPGAGEEGGKIAPTGDPVTFSKIKKYNCEISIEISKRSR